MQVSVEAGEGLERRMQVELPAEQIHDEVEKRLQRLARTARLAGFRPGRVPIGVLRQRYGEQLHREVLGDRIQASFTEALEQAGLRPAGRPHIEPQLDPATAQFGYTAVFEILPAIELSALGGQTLRRPVCALTDADLDETLDRIRQQNRTWTPVERACQTGDRVTVSSTATVDGEPLASGTTNHLQLELGSGRMLPGFEEGLIGAASGETRVLELQLPASYPPALAGRAARFEVAVESVAEPRLPEIDAEFVQRFGIADGDLDRFRAEVRANMERERDQRIEARTKERAMDLLLAAHDFPLPASLVHDEIQSMVEEMRRTLRTPGLQLPTQLFQTAAERRVRIGLLLGELIRHWGLQASPEAVRERIERLAAAYEDPDAVIQQYYANPQQLATMEALVVESQVVARVLEQVQVEDEPLRFHALADAPPTAA